MKIVHIVPSFARGGAERLVIELANRQAAAGHDVQILVGHRLPDELVHEPPDPAVGLIYVAPRPLSRVQRYIAAMRWLTRNREWLAKQDILHAHLTYGAAFSSAFRRVTRGAQGGNSMPAVIETYHAVGMPISRIMRWWHTRMAIQHDALALMVDDNWWSRVAELHPRLKKVVIPVGVFDPPVMVTSEQNKRYRASLRIPEGALVVGTIGRMAAERQTHRYARILAEIATRCGGHVHFVVGGDGPERRRVEAAFEEAFPTESLRQRVHFTGLVRDLPEALSVMDLYITSNIRAACGVAGLQAIAAGVPAIGLQLQRDYLSGAGDWIWSSNKEGEVGARAAHLLNAVDQRRSLQQRQRAYLDQHHSASAMAAAYEELYEDTISRRQREGYHAS